MPANYINNAKQALTAITNDMHTQAEAVLVAEEYAGLVGAGSSDTDVCKLFLEGMYAHLQRTLESRGNQRGRLQAKPTVEQEAANAKGKLKSQKP